MEKPTKLSSRITFKRFDQVFKSFKIGNKEYASDFAGYWGTEAQIKGKTAKIQVAPAAGYKIDKIVAVMPDGRVGSPCGACREYMMQLDRIAEKLKFLLDLETKKTVRLKELVPDWWGYDRFRE